MYENMCVYMYIICVYICIYVCLSVNDGVGRAATDPTAPEPCALEK